MAIKDASKYETAWESILMSTDKKEMPRLSKNLELITHFIIQMVSKRYLRWNF